MHLNMIMKGYGLTLLVHFLGSTTFPNSLLRSVNVKDVATAHILAYEIPSANGRYCLVESVNHFSDVVAIIRRLYPSLHLPDK